MSFVGDVLRFTCIGLLASVGALALSVDNASAAQLGCATYPGLPS